MHCIPCMKLLNCTIRCIIYNMQIVYACFDDAVFDEAGKKDRQDIITYIYF